MQVLKLLLNVLV